MIRKTYERVPARPSPTGSDIIVKYRLERDSKGNCIYSVKGEMKISEYVKSFSKGCSLSSLLERCSFMTANDIIASVNRVSTPIYGDTTVMPKDLTDAVCKINDLRKENPEIFNKISNGEKVEDIIKASAEANSKKSEVVENGKSE